jgi:hypothetical protein
MLKQYQTFILKKDLNAVIKSGMTRVVLEIFDESNYEVEFVKGDGTNYEFEGKFTFTITSNEIA